VINLATGLEDAERATVAFLVGGARYAEAVACFAVAIAETVDQRVDYGRSSPTGGRAQQRRSPR
jgi:hypothetical protein